MDITLIIYLVCAVLVSIVVTCIKYEDNPVEAGIIGLIAGMLNPLVISMGILLSIAWLLGNIAKRILGK